MSRTDKPIVDAVRSTLGDCERCVLAVSGGMDSMTLLDAAARVLDRDRVVVATFDHGTGRAAREAVKLVQARAAELRVHCEAGTASRPLRSEAALRSARWAFLRHVMSALHAQHIVTAHTADDQIETVLMRVLRGAHARGLAGLYAGGGPLRPLVEIRRTTITEYARARRLRWADDPSNVSRAYLRNRVRHELLPALRSARPALESELLEIARAAAAWRRDVDDFVTHHLSVRGSPDDDAFRVDAASLGAMSTEELAVVWPALAGRFGVALDRRGIARLAAFSRGSRVGSRIQVSGGWSAVRSRDAIDVHASGVRAPDSVRIDLAEPTTWGRWAFRPNATSTPDGLWSLILPSDAPLTVRGWEPGDRMQSTRGGGAPRKVKQLLSRAGVTGHKRAGWPVVLAGDEIVWIPGVRGSKITERLGTSGVPFSCEYIDR